MLVSRWQRLGALIALIVLVFVGANKMPAAQQQYDVFLPLVIGEADMASAWWIVVPEETYNRVLNPSGEIAGNFAAVGGTATRVATYNLYGNYSYRVQTAANNQGMTLTLSTLANAIHYVTVAVQGTLPAAWDWSVDNATYTAPTMIRDYGNGWYLYGLQFPAAQCNGSTTLYIYQNGAGAGDFYLDGVQVEQKTYWTTYCDGDQEDCEWRGPAHAAASYRSATTRAGGRVRNMSTDYYFYVSGMNGIGMPRQTIDAAEYAILPGGQIYRTRDMIGTFTLTGMLTDPTWDDIADVHTARRALINVLKPDIVPYKNGKPQPVRLRYTGTTPERQISVIYEDGLTLQIDSDIPCWERLALRFLQADPYSYAIGTTSVALDTLDSITMRYITARLRSTGQWSALGLTANPTADGEVYAILIAQDGTVYVGGEFTGMDGVAGRDNIARYDPIANTWSTVGGASALNGQVWALAQAPNGLIYIGGEFTNAGAVAAADYFATFDPATDTWSTLGTPSAGATISSVRTIAINSSGHVYVGGIFTNFAGVAAADYFAYWSGAAWTTHGTPSGGGAVITYSSRIVIDSADQVYVTGAFGDWAGVANANGVVMWNGTAWVALSSGLSALAAGCSDIVRLQDDLYYIGGTFTNGAGNPNIDYIAQWNGAGFGALSTGLGGGLTVRLGYGPDGILYVTGQFLEAGGITAWYIAQWNGSSFAHMDIDPAIATQARAIAAGNMAPGNTSLYDLYIGTDSPGAADIAGLTTVTNSGVTVVWPTFTFERVGGSYGFVKSIRNEDTGATLYIDYSLQDGEKLVVQLDPENTRIWSTFAGDVPGALLPNSDVGTFTLLPGANRISAYMDPGGAGAPTLTCTISFKEAYAGLD